MYSRKSVEPRMECCGTPALTRYSCEDFLPRTTVSYLLLRKKRSKAKYLTWNSIRLKNAKPCQKPWVYQVLNILKNKDHWWNLQTFWKARLFQTHIEEYSWYLRKIMLTVHEAMMITRSHWKCTKHVTASQLYKNDLVILNVASFYVSMSSRLPSLTFKHKLYSKVKILGKRTPSRKALLFKSKMLPILI